VGCDSPTAVLLSPPIPAQISHALLFNLAIANLNQMHIAGFTMQGAFNPRGGTNGGLITLTGGSLLIRFAYRLSATLSQL